MIRRFIAPALLLITCVASLAAKFGSNTTAPRLVSTMACSPEADIVLVTTNLGEVLKSEDGGGNFSKLPGFGTKLVGEIPATGVACSADGQTVFICTGTRQILKPSDGGQSGLRSFAPLKGTGSKYAGEFPATSITCSSDGQTLFVISVDASLFRSTDGGNHFTKM